METRIYRALTAIIIVIMSGTACFMWIEGWDFWKALFFTIITITTVGYGDYGLSEMGARFTAILLLGGISVATYSLGQLAQGIVEYQLGWERIMQKKINNLSDHLIICGMGRIGKAVCKELAQAGVPFVIIDYDNETVAELTNQGYLTVLGDAADDDILIKAGIKKAKGLTCVSSSDTHNIVVTLSAHGINPDLFIISRAEQEDASRKIRRAGATRIISPCRSGGISVANTILNPTLADFLEQSSDSSQGIAMSEMTIEPESELAGKTILDTGKSFPSIVFVAIKHPDKETRLRPSAKETLNVNDILIVAGSSLTVSQMRQAASNLAKAA